MSTQFDRLRECGGVIRIDVGPVGHALLFDEIALAGQHSQDARDDLDE
jgi:hypothetical protein